MQRRQFVRAAGVVSVAGLGSVAGCSGDGGDPGGDGPEGMDAPNDGSSSTDAPGQDADDAGDGPGEGGDPGGDGPGDSGDDGDAASGGEGSPFASTIAFNDAYVMEMEYEDDETGESGTATVRFSGGNSHMEFVTSEGTFEIYGVDGDMYMIENGRCTLMRGQSDAPDETFGPSVSADAEEFEDDVGRYPELEPAGTATIEGERVLVYEVEETEHSDYERATYYVSASNGYLRRVETDDGRMDFHSWGSVGPITAPDVDCEELDFGNFGQ